MTRRRSTHSAVKQMLLLSLTFAICGPHRARAQTPNEYSVKAAFLYNFTKFVEWPPEAFQTPADPFTVCVIGENPFGSGLEDTVRGKNFNGRPFVQKQIRGVAEAKGCQILFVSSSARQEAREIARALRGTGVLTVGDAPGLAQQGVVADFTLKDNRVRFEFNIEAADSAHLKISSKLLSLATIVQ